MEWVGTTDGSTTRSFGRRSAAISSNGLTPKGRSSKRANLLFELDPSKFQTALDQALGDLAKAQAQFTKTKQDVERDTPLAKEGAISQKELDDSIQAHAAKRHGRRGQGGG